MEKLLCPSLMVADFTKLSEEVIELDQSGSDIFHIDIMDGSFVPNFGMGIQDVQAVRKLTSKPIDVHLMIDNPGEYINLFADLGVDIIYVHPEADKHPARTLNKIKDRGLKVGLAINPGTSLENIVELLNIIDYLMIMTVNPGFAGQKYLSFVDAKIEKALSLSKQYGFEVMVDGAISPERIEKLSKIGVKGFVLGTSSLFRKEKSYKELISMFKQL